MRERINIGYEQDEESKIRNLWCTPIKINSQRMLDDSKHISLKIEYLLNS